MIMRKISKSIQKINRVVDEPPSVIFHSRSISQLPRRSAYRRYNGAYSTRRRCHSRRWCSACGSRRKRRLVRITLGQLAYIEARSARLTRRFFVQREDFAPNRQDEVAPRATIWPSEILNRR